MSMAKWSIFTDGELELTNSWFDYSLNEFFANLNDYLQVSNYTENCYCQRDTKTESYFEKFKL